MQNFINIDKIFDLQKNYFKLHETKDINFRIRQLEILKCAIESYEKKIIEALKLDLGKSEFETYETEIAIVLSEIKHVKKDLKKWAKPKKVKRSLSSPTSKNFIYSQPYGVCLIMAPWNYPFQLCISPLIGAIMAGNTAIIKPSELAPNTSKVIYEMISKYFDEKYIAVVEGEIAENQYLLDKNFDYIFFTGSPMIGKIVMEKASKNLIPVTLELGGKSPCIVDKDIHNIKLCAKRVAWGKLLNNGQTCIAPDYIIVHKKVKKLFLDEVINNIKSFYGDNALENNDYAKVVNERHFNRLISLIEPQKVLYGGNYNRDTLKIEPTILDNISLDDKIMQEEIFGPLMPILEFENIDDILNIINYNENPLAMYIFTKNKKFEEELINKVSFGGGCVNDTIMHISNPNLPFGGIKTSGIGSYHGKKSFETFSHQKSIVKASMRLDLSFIYPPYTKNNLNLIRKLFKFI
jgi:aldehyde dehydrogenase (NAD+)